MSISQILALLRDVVIVGGISWIGLFVYRSGENADVKQDLAAIQQQLAANAANEARWDKERLDAEAQRTSDMVAVTAAINSQRTPVLLCNKAGSGSVSRSPSPSPSSTPSAGGSTEGSGENIRSEINAFELKYEAYLGQCRSLLKSWPH